MKDKKKKKMTTTTDNDETNKTETYNEDIWTTTAVAIINETYFVHKKYYIKICGYSFKN